MFVVLVLFQALPVVFVLFQVPLLVLVPVQTLPVVLLELQFDFLVEYFPLLLFQYYFLD